MCFLKNVTVDISIGALRKSANLVAHDTIIGVDTACLTQNTDIIIDTN